MVGIVKLFCWVLTSSDTTTTEPFLVDIEKEKTVDDLKTKMKKLQEHTFGGLDTSTIRVWKVSDCSELTRMRRPDISEAISTHSFH